MAHAAAPSVAFKTNEEKPLMTREKVQKAKGKKVPTRHSFQVPQWGQVPSRRMRCPHDPHT